jgi:MoxR-like ATPase
MTYLKISLPKKSFSKGIFSPNKYVLDEGLHAAVQVALTLGQPLLLTGEPGTGKTLLAYRIAHDLARDDASFLPKPLVFHTKTTSKATDMLYTYDALRHFHDANLRKTQGESVPDTSDYIQLQALGKAIALTDPDALASGQFVQEKEPVSSVVLIDEIDKAPRDFPNDILHEIENYNFQIKEANNLLIQKGAKQRIVVVLTSNSEKHLPEAFLRRCVFYHIPFPAKDTLIQIVESQLGAKTNYSDEELIDHFLMLRSLMKKKKPATAELIAWLRILEMNHFLDSSPNWSSLDEDQKRILRQSYAVIAKTQDDLRELEKWLGG